MRILVVIPHYFGQSQPENSSPIIGSYIEPLGRIAALSGTIVGLNRHFGTHRMAPPGANVSIDVDPKDVRLDIVILTLRDHNLVSELDLAPGMVEVEYLTCQPTRIPLQVPKVLKDRFGSFDFYCYLEDDLVIHDPLFFSKLLWFQQNFGAKALLAPVRFEMGSSGLAAKAIVDPVLPDAYTIPFRRPGQREEIEAVWHGRPQTFRLPNNPHAASFFLSEEQMAYWMGQPSFDDQDISWVGPIESAATLSVGKVFDIYKPTHPDPFFLELHHHSCSYIASMSPPGVRIGESPLLAIAQNALRATIAANHGAAHPPASLDGAGNESFQILVKRWLAQGTAAEVVGQLETAKLHLHNQQQKVAELTARLNEQEGKICRLKAELNQGQTEIDRLTKRLRLLRPGFWLEKARAAIRRCGPKRPRNNP